MLVTIGQADDGVTDVVIYLHVSSRIKQEPPTQATTRYMFDGSNPDDVFKDNAGIFLPYQAFAVSDNGRWIVTELRNKGLALIDTTNFSARRIQVNGLSYGWGFDPAESLAVSADGKSAVVTGFNADFAVIDITPKCGQALSGDFSVQPDGTDCALTTLGIRGIAEGFWYGESPRFYGNGQELDVTVHSRSEGIRRLTYLQSGAASEHKLKLLALGDSFTSGEGETDIKYYEKGTNDAFDTCHVSTRSYPFLVGRALGIGDSDVKSVACAGATTKDIKGSNDDYWGQKERLGPLGLNLALSVKTVAQEEALNDFQPGRSLQSTFLDRYSPEIATIGIGGNDAGLMKKLSTCAAPGTCEWAQSDGLRETAGEIKRLFDTLSAFYDHLLQTSPRTKFFVVGYPDVIDPDGTCDPVTGTLLDHTERVFIDQSLQYLNQVIRAAAKQKGFTYLDIEHSLDGKRLCDEPHSTAMNGLRLGGDIPVTSALPMLKIIGAETFHPTPTGHELIAGAILTGHPGLQQDAGCSVDDAACLATPPDIEPSAYWNVQDGTSNRQAYVTEFARQVGANASLLSIAIPDHTLQPLSNVMIEIHSDTISLGTFTADADGSMTGEVTLPGDIEPGFHTLHMYGTNQDNAPIDLYQIIAVGQDGQVTGIDSGGVGTLPLQSSPAGLTNQITDTAGTAAVLGAEGVSLARSGVQSMLAQQISYVKHSLNDRGMVWVIIVAGISTLSLVLCIILLLRRWAKPGS